MSDQLGEITCFDFIDEIAQLEKERRSFNTFNEKNINLALSEYTERINQIIQSIQTDTYIPEMEKSTMIRQLETSIKNSKNKAKRLINDSKNLSFQSYSTLIQLRRTFDSEINKISNDQTLTKEQQNSIISALEQYYSLNKTGMETYLMGIRKNILQGFLDTADNVIEPEVFFDDNI